MGSQLPEGYELHEWTSEEVSRFWDFIAQAQPDAYFSHRVGRNLAWRFRSEIRSADRVLDYGCGSGRFLEELLKAGGAAAGFDTSPSSRSVARDRLAGFAQFGGVFGPEQIGDHRESFDLAFCIEVVEHLYDPQLDKVLSDLCKLLRSGGRVIITTPNDEDLAENWICNPVTGKVFHRWQHVRSWTPEGLAERIRQSGFEVDSVATCNAAAIGITPKAALMRFAYAVRRSTPESLFLVARRP